MISSIERGTRWAIASPHDPLTQQRVGAQITTFLSGLREAGAFASATPDDAFLVICDERINDGANPVALNILVQFAAIHSGGYHSFMIIHTARGSLVRPVAINRLEASLLIADELAREITIRVHHEPDVVRMLAS